VTEGENPFALPHLETGIVVAFGKKPPRHGNGRAVVHFGEKLDATKVMLLLEKIALIVGHLIF